MPWAAHSLARPAAGFAGARWPESDADAPHRGGGRDIRRARVLVGPHRAVAGAAGHPARRARRDPLLRRRHGGPPWRDRLARRAAVLALHRQHHRDAAPSILPSEHAARLVLRRPRRARIPGAARPARRGGRARRRGWTPWRAAAALAGSYPLARRRYCSSGFAACSAHSYSEFGRTPRTIVASAEMPSAAESSRVFKTIGAPVSGSYMYMWTTTRR